MKFSDFLREKENTLNKEAELRVIDFFLNTDEITDDKIHGLADELQMEAHALENVIYKLFKELLTRQKEELQ